MKKIVSKVDEMLKIVMEEGRVPFSELARRLNVTVDLVEEWAKILEERDDIVIMYPPNPFSEPYLEAKKVKVKKGPGILRRIFGRKKVKQVKKKERKVKKKKLKLKKAKKRKKRRELVQKESPLYHLYRRLFG